MSQLRLLDLYCCEGGAAVGYANAGYEVVGVDITITGARYPYEFHQGDAVEYLKEHGHEFDVIHASPPCQRYSHATAARSKAGYPDLIARTRDALEASGKPWVMENVVGAPLRDPMTLCWSMFREPGSVLDQDGTPLQMRRHRLFESNVAMFAPAQCSHAKDVQVAGSYGGARRDKAEAKYIRKGGYTPHKSVQEQLLGIDWMTQRGLHQAIPPMYSEHVGKALLRECK